MPLKENPTSMSEFLPIDGEYLKRVLLDLLEIPSPTGYTDEIVRFCCHTLDDLGIHYELTRRGAIRARLQGSKRQPARAFIAHVDTLGAQVRELKSNGRLGLVPIGHWSSRFAEGTRCTLLTASGAYRGTILPLKASGHTYGDEIDQQPVNWDQVELRVDVDSTCEADLRGQGIAIGDHVAIDPRPEFLDNGYLNSRHLDDKAGVAVMFAALKALVDSGAQLPVDTYFLLSISEEVGVGASAVLHGDIASMVTIDNGTTAPGQNSSEYGVTIAMADSSGPFDYHLTKKLIDLCEQYRIDFQRDIFRHYRCDSASAVEAGNDIRTALITFGVDASHGCERIHEQALTSLGRLITCYVQSDVEIGRDAHDMSSLKGFTTQPFEPAEDGS
ncbi:MAG: osmoprotectant NAGGN system M42 family peptidase [Gammaproteobacteria bacterium]|jgi:peptidase M42 family hydrolase|nr:osmoprotectant NAGGN system M42 family peptidase [Gammaproteobacteria bacterium]